jgi:UDP-GlcNAc:undecaprenyl-phosphate/decaprenyl-phosphate GlcNAc-1-phosphate transferase
MSRIDGALVAFLITLLFLLALRPVAIAVGLVDRPGGRKQHVGVVPVIGGISMFLGLVIALTLTEPVAAGTLSFLVAAGLLVLVGVIDDRFDLPAKVRLTAQTTAGLILCLGTGLVATNLGNILFFGDISLGFLAIPFTVLVTISVINAYNMMDGMDGLAGSVTLAALSSVAIALVLFDGSDGLAVALASIAVVLAFLMFNFPVPWNRPVRTFMGDAGSTFLGFTVIYLGLKLAHGSEPIISPVTALWIAALPIFDLFISFGRRIAKGQSPLQPDRQHFHHILQRAGLSDRQILLVMAGAAFIVSMTGILAHQAGVPDGVLFFGLIVLGFLQYLTIRRAWRLARWIGRRRRQFLARR